MNCLFEKITSKACFSRRTKCSITLRMFLNACKHFILIVSCNCGWVNDLRLTFYFFAAVCVNKELEKKKRFVQTRAPIFLSSISFAIYQRCWLYQWVFFTSIRDIGSYYDSAVFIELIAGLDSFRLLNLILR